MRYRLIAIGLAALLVGLLGLAASGAARDVLVIPLLYAGWLARVLYLSVPQALIWIVLLLVATFSAVRGLSWAQPASPLQTLSAARRTTIGDWARLLRRAEQSDYARWSLAQRLGTLSGEVFAPRGRERGRPLWALLDEGAIDLPPEAQAYLRAGTSVTPTASRPARRWAVRLGHWPPWRRLPDPLALDPEVLVRLLEERLQLHLEK